MKKIFVGNLAWKATEEDLRSLFEAHGPVVSIKIITDQYTGKSKGFAFVEMGDAESADKAIKALNDYPLHERNLRVSLANERSERPSRGGSSERREYRGGGNGNGNGNSRGGESSYRSRSHQESY